MSAFFNHLIADLRAFVATTGDGAGSLSFSMGPIEARSIVQEADRLREALGRIAATPLDIYPGEKSEIARDALAGKPNPNPLPPKGVSK